jgi:hypothetical protein
VTCSINYNNKTLTSGYITNAWSSKASFCNPQGDGVSKDRCFLGNFEWTPVDASCKDLHIYDPADPSKLVFGFKRLCKTPILFYLPNSSYVYPRLSALRLLGFNTIVPVTQGVTADSQPKIVDHVLGDFDMESLVSLATFERINGPAVANLVGFSIPVGFGLPWAKVRWGYNYISPQQQSFAPTHGQN